MNKEVLADKRISTMTRIENTLNSVKGEARSYASLVRALWDTRRSRAALPGQGTTEYAILVGVLVVIAIIAITVFRPKIQELWDAISSGIIKARWTKRENPTSNILLMLQLAYRAMLPKPLLGCMMWLKIPRLRLRIFGKEELRPKLSKR